ncbi:phosphonate C-P lyase system protein PhnL [Paracoccus simplex]|uniref:Phosphonate C-P lyase system protein PhnL n=1 Tax=Paracoccus simplex TaxID=2086346 RepID=A0ABV7RVW4_9RHOB
MIRIENLSKTFTLHNQAGAVLRVMEGANLTVEAGECVGLTGQSGAGKSTLMRMIHGNYLAASGSIRVAGLDVVTAQPRQIIALRRDRLGYVSQFLRVVPRVPTIEVVAEPLRRLGTPEAEARTRAAALLARLNIPERLWGLSPTTFSGGEQQRVNIARGFAHPFPVLLLDEPTASLDAANREVVLSLIEEAKARGAAILGIFHDEAARVRVCDRLVDVTGFTPGAAA